MKNLFSGDVFDNTTLEQYRHFLSSVSEFAIYMLSPDGIVNSWNIGAQLCTGYTPQEIVGQNFAIFYTEEDRVTGKPAKSLHLAFAQGKYEEEGWRVRKDGTLFWTSVVTNVIFDEQGQLLGFAKIARDITKVSEYEQEMRASEEQFRLLVQGVTDYAIYMLSPTGEVTNWNAGAERIKGYTQEEVIGTHFSRFYSKEDQANGLPMEALERAAKEGRFEMEGWRVRKDSSKFWANVVIDAIYDASGELVGFAKITRDITERRENAQALEQAREALFQTQKLDAVGKLTGGIAHDFNNLLAIIVSGLERLSIHPETPPNSKVLEAMQRAADRAAALTQQLLTFARQQPTRQEFVNLNRVIESFEPVLRRVGEKNITFDLNLAPELSSVLVDVTQFEAALLNLVTNARHAMPNGGAMCLSTEELILLDNQISNLKAGRFVKITVEDTGYGMAPEIIERALEPFFTTKAVGQGTGLGLSQVYGFVQQSEGAMILDSEVGIGTTVSLYLPTIVPAENEETCSKDSSARKEKVLVVDDEPETLNVAVALFENMGYEVLFANDGNEALNVFKRVRDISVLFTDILMPGMNGIALAQAAQKISPNVRVFLTSEHPEDAFPYTIEEGEVNFLFIRKPYRMAEIAKQLRMIG